MSVEGRCENRVANHDAESRPPEKSYLTPFSAYTQDPGAIWEATAFNGFEYSGLTFAGGGTLTGVTLGTNMVGLTLADVSISGGDIFINYAGLSTTSATGGPVYATLNLIATPEPATLPLPLARWLVWACSAGAWSKFHLRKRTEDREPSRPSSF